MGIFKKFICNSGTYHPKRSEPDGCTIEFFEDGANRRVRVNMGYGCPVCMKINLYATGACRIHSVDTSIPEVFDWLDETCDIKSDNWWDYRYWNDVEKFMRKLVDYIKNN